MSFSLCYWILMLLWLVLGLWIGWTPAGPGYRFVGFHLLQFVLFVLIGWKLFGAPLHP